MEYVDTIGYVLETYINGNKKLARDIVKEQNYKPKDLINYCKNLDMMTYKILDHVAEIFV
jgi:hypothetical protein